MFFLVAHVIRRHRILISDIKWQVILLWDEDTHLYRKNINEDRKRCWELCLTISVSNIYIQFFIVVYVYIKENKKTRGEERWAEEKRPTAPLSWAWIDQINSTTGGKKQRQRQREWERERDGKRKCGGVANIPAFPDKALGRQKNLLGGGGGIWGQQFYFTINVFFKTKQGTLLPSVC